MAHTVWEIVKPNKELSRRIAEKWSIPGFAAHLLATRGFDDDEKIEMMLGCVEPSFFDPFIMKDMDKAVARIEKAIDSFESIAVYGDYDVDGVTSAAMMCSYLEMSGANAYAIIPDREKDGYGMKKNAIDEIRSHGTTLIITVDNGISAIEEVEYAKQLGIDVVVTDHHQPGETLPNAVAVVNPHRADDESPFRLFAGVGVAFKLLCALSGDAQLVLDNYSDLVALGTIADVVPLINENRSIVRIGLEAINERERPGISTLCAAAGAADKQLNAVDVAFTLAPRINAAGRMGSADRAFKLLLSEDFDEANDLSIELNSENVRRHEEEKMMLIDTGTMIAERPELLLDKVIVLDADGWNKGIIGIFASKVCEGYGKPCFVISRGEDGMAHGSARSMAGFSLYDALCACSDILVAFGGHEQAAGLTLKNEDIETFRRRINDYAAGREMPMPKICIDCELSPKHINMGLYEASLMLEPFGESNPFPVIALNGCRLGEIIHLKEGRHQKLILDKDGASVEAMLFSVSTDLFPYKKGDTVDVAVRLSKNEFRGRESLSLTVVSIKPAGIERKLTIEDERLFEKIKRKEVLTGEEKERLLPERAQTESVYRFLRANGGFAGDTEVLFARLCASGIDSYARLLVIIEVLNQCGLLEVTGSGAKTRIALKQVTEKADLASCEMMQCLA